MQYRIVHGNPVELVGDFIAAAQDLVAHGCDGLTTKCGFLALIQDQVSAAVPVPVATSSLMQIPMVQAMLPLGKRVGIITISSAFLTEAHLKAAGLPVYSIYTLVNWFHAGLIPQRFPLELNDPIRTARRALFA